MKMWKFVATLFVFTLLNKYQSADAAYPLKILGIFPHEAVSHFIFFHPLLRGLAEAGHEVTVISHFPDKSPPARYRDLVLKESPLTGAIDLQHFEKPVPFYKFQEFFILKFWALQSCQNLLRSEALAQVLKKKNYYDIIITEHFNSDCPMAVAHVLNAPVIAMSSSQLLPWLYERYGLPYNPSYIPVVLLGYSENMNFIARVKNWVYFHTYNAFYKYSINKEIDAMVQYKFGHDIPPVEELGKTTAAIFVNTHYSLIGARPLSPMVIEMGGLHIKQAKPLDEKFQKFIDNAEHGVVIISWGSMIKADTMPVEKREGILKAIKRLKQRVIWKWENDTLSDIPDNLMISKWLPQRDILCHPNVKVFMSHGGLMGTSEATYCGVSMVVTPMYGDQFVNAAAIANREMGVILNYHDISENSVMRSIRKVLDKKYLDNAKAVSYSYKHRPQTALQTGIWWVEHIAHTKGAPLTRSPALHMSSFVIESFDVYLFLISILIAVIASWYWIFRQIFKKKQTVDVKKKSN